MTTTADILTTIINDLQAYHRAITGVVSAPALANYPTAIDTMDLPYVICWPTDSTWHQKGQGGALKRVDQGIEVLVYTMLITQNDIPSRAPSDVILLQRFRNTYLDNTLTLVQAPSAATPYEITIESSESSPHGDSGLRADLQYGGRPFAGFSLRIRVRALW